MKRTAKDKPKIDWSRVDAMSEAERHAAAMADPDARPMTDAEWARAPRVPQVSIIRRALKLSQEQFATTFHIPIGTIRDWEQGRYEPDAAARAYLRVIAREPELGAQGACGANKTEPVASSDLRIQMAIGLTRSRGAAHGQKTRGRSPVDCGGRRHPPDSGHRNRVLS